VFRKHGACLLGFEKPVDYSAASLFPHCTQDFRERFGNNFLTVPVIGQMADHRVG
jgi:hypothetical protein